MHAGAAIVLVIVILLLGGAIGWVLFSRIRAQRLGLPPPSWSSFIPFRDSSSASYGVQPAPGGITGWINDRIRSFKNRNNRTAAGAYEGASRSGAAPRHGFGALDPDDAWDSRVGAEADAYYYNEERELGLHGGGGGGGGAASRPGNSGSRLDVSTTAYLGGGAAVGSSYDMNVPTEGGEELEERGRSRGRSPQPGASKSAAPNPFDDDADPSNMSLRGVSPRPMGDAAAAASSSQGNTADSPSERRSMFRENV